MDVAIHHRHLGELDLAVSLDERAVRLAQGGPQVWVLFLEGHLAQTLLHRGDFAASARSAGSRYTTHTAAVRTQSLRGCSGILRWFHFPWPLWCLGYPDRALQVSQAALEIAAGRRARRPSTYYFADAR